ncbi:MAG: DUF502 domain-containing protein [Rhodospirillaceae bacterium]|nr:DUF502 domain-containing protein [Rhodospirillaceae bacterium]
MTTPAPTKVAMPGLRRSLMARLRRYFLAGVLVTAPIGITVYVAWSIITAVDRTVVGLLPPGFNLNTYLPFEMPGVGLVTLVVGLTLAGFLTANYLGRFMVRLGEGIVARMPVIRSLYSAVKQIFEAVLKERETSFSEVVMVEYPRRGMWTLGLVIGETHGEIQARTTEKMYNVYLPTTPNPTSGYLVFLPRSDMIHLDMSVEDCMKMIVSGGIVTPPYDPKSGPAKPADEAGPP